MSKCIGVEGEWSDHEPGDHCPRCGAFNEDHILAERDALRGRIDALEAERAEMTEEWLCAHTADEEDQWAYTDHEKTGHNPDCYYRRTTKWREVGDDC